MGIVGNQYVVGSVFQIGWVWIIEFVFFFQVLDNEFDILVIVVDYFIIYFDVDSGVVFFIKYIVYKLFGEVGFIY